MLLKRAFGEDTDQKVFVIYLRALELMDALKETHYCFLHGQSQEVYSFNHLIKEYHSAADPKCVRKYRQIFRLPADLENCASTVKEFDEKYKRCNPFSLDVEAAVELLAVSGYPLANDGAESAYSFIKKNP